MPKRTIKCRQVRNQGGKIYTRFSDKSELEFSSRAELKRWIRDTLNDNVLRALVLSAVIEDADAVPLSQCDGKRITIDFSQAQPLVIAQE